MGGSLMISGTATIHLEGIDDLDPCLEAVFRHAKPGTDVYVLYDLGPWEGENLMCEAADLLMAKDGINRTGDWTSIDMGNAHVAAIECSEATYHEILDKLGDQL